MVGKLPRVTCRECSKDKAARHCPKHKLVRCAECDQWVSEAHIHLEYVGHAGVTDRLLQVDPAWSWEPMAVDDHGAPLMIRSDGALGMWINLTISGVTRPGFGDGPTPKEVISDAIRNAAMRFGVALDLWSKQPLLDESLVKDDEPSPARRDPLPTPAGDGGAAAGPASAAAPPTPKRASNAQLATMSSLIEAIRRLDAKADLVENYDKLKASPGGLTMSAAAATNIIGRAKARKELLEAAEKIRPAKPTALEAEIAQAERDGVLREVS